MKLHLLIQILIKLLALCALALTALVIGLSLRLTAFEAMKVELLDALHRVVNTGRTVFAALLGGDSDDDFTPRWTS